MSMYHYKSKMYMYFNMQISMEGNYVHHNYTNIYVSHGNVHLKVYYTTNFQSLFYPLLRKISKIPE